MVASILVVSHCCMTHSACRLPMPRAQTGAGTWEGQNWNDRPAATEHKRLVWCGVVWCGVVRCGAVWCVVWCGVSLSHLADHNRSAK
eukprot:4276067-Alexandrium_andersonii.AAC.1